MTGKTAAVAIAVVALAAVITSLTFSTAPPEPPPPTGIANLDRVPDAGSTGHDEAAGAATLEGGETYPPPIDLDSANRDLDLHGRVVDEKGQPVPGATVETIRWPWRRSSVLNVEGSDESESGPSTRSSTDGSFLLRLPRADLVDLRVAAEGRAEVRVQHCQAGERLTIVLEPGAEVEVVCTDEAGNPVGGVRVTLTGPETHRVGSTDETGRYLFTGVPPGWSGLQFVHPVLGSPRTRGPEIPATGRVVVEVTMPEGRTIRGTARDGRFRLTSLRRDIGPHTLIVQAAGHAKLLHDFEPHPDIPGEIVLFDLALSQPRRLEGRVIDADGSPVRGAYVMLHMRTSHAVRISRGGDEERRTDDLGRFRFRDLPAGKYEVFVRQTGYPFMRTDAVILPDRDILDLVFRRSSTRRLAVQVLGPDGKPVAGVHIGCASVTIPVNGQTGEDGCVVFDGVPAREFQLRAYVTSEAFLRHPGVTVGPGDTEVTIRLERAVVVRGAVLDPKGRPVPNVYVFTHSPDGKRISNGSTRTNENGRFTLKLAPDATVELKVDGQRSDRSFQDADQFLDIEGRLPGVTGPRDGVEIRTARVEWGRSLTVVVLDTQGGPLADTAVFLNVRGREWLEVSGPDGTVRFTDLPAAEVRIRAARRSRTSASEKWVYPKETLVTPAGQRVELPFREGTILRGIVRGPDGEAVGSAFVGVMTDQRITEPRMADPTGHFRCPALPGVGHRVWATGKDADSNPLSGELTDVKPEDGEVVIRIKRSAR